jgi:hypothetical protein
MLVHVPVRLAEEFHHPSYLRAPTETSFVESGLDQRLHLRVSRRGRLRRLLLDFHSVLFGHHITARSGLIRAVGTCLDHQHLSRLCQFVLQGVKLQDDSQTVCVTPRKFLHFGG